MKLVIQDDSGKVIGMIDAVSRGKERPFSSGSTGYYVSGKVNMPSVIDGESKTHQVTCSIVEIGTKGRFQTK